MFTGIVESVGVVTSFRAGAGGKVLSVDVGGIVDGVGLGDSIAVNGVCLTVCRLAGSVCDFDVSGETEGNSSIGSLRAGSRVNLERAMAAGGRFGGHIVQGHVDGTAVVRSVKRVGEFSEIEFSVDEKLADEMIVKGSVCVDGISLTIARMGAGSFVVSVIPTTLRETNLGDGRAGDVVNIETDIISKTVKSRLDKMLGGGGRLSVERLRELGF